MVNFSEQFPDEETRNEFGRNVIKELEESSLHICATTYMVVGRKPDLAGNSE